MARFPRPADAIENVADLRVGDKVWHVYGIWPPIRATEPATITRAVCKFSEHPEFESFSTQGDCLVFDYRPEGWGLPRALMAFASDGNLESGNSHNDNYWFRTEEAAEAAREYLHSQWLTRPDLIEQEQFLRRSAREFEYED